MNLFPQDFVAPLLPLIGTLSVPTLENQKTLSQWESKVSLSLGGDHPNSVSSNLELQGIFRISGTTGGPLFKIVKLSKARIQPGVSPTLPGQPLSASAFSPNNPSSPLYPDGIMTPGWIRKHRDSYPGVILGFYELWKGSAGAQSNPDLVGNTGGMKRKDPLGAQHNNDLSPEREQDSRLFADINEKRKMAAEKGMKWIILLILPSHSASEDGQIEERVQFLKRHCGLESKVNLFTIVKDSTDENYIKFIKSLTKGLTEAVFLYYKDQEKRLKKKRSKIGNISRVTGGNGQKVLSPQGWLVRYDFKLATFAEFRGDAEAMVKFLESAYQILAQWMKATASPSAAPGGGMMIPNLNYSLTHFSLRWYEASAILNCLNYKIIKSTIGSKATVSAMLQFSKHVAICKSFPEYSLSLPTFSQIGFLHPDLSKLGNLLGGGSFDYWSWLSQQFATLAELLESAENRVGLSFPFPPIGSIPITNLGSSGAQVMANSMATGALGHTVEGVLSLFGPYSGVNFSLLTQHPGYYYWIAALCAEERAHRFHSSQDAVHSTSAQFLSSKTESVKALIQGLQAERLVNHSALSLELYVKAYDQFKKRNASRMALHMSKEIAKIRVSQGEYEVALQLYEHIANSYRREGWILPLYSILKSLLKAAEESKNWRALVTAIFEIVSPKFSFVSLEDRRGYLEYLLQLLGQSDTPFALETLAVEEDIRINMSERTSFFKCSASLSNSNILASEPLYFQVFIQPSNDLSFIASKISLTFSNPYYNVTIVHDHTSHLQHFDAVDFAKCGPPSTKSPVSRHGDVKVDPSNTFQANLIISNGRGYVLEGALTPNTLQDLHLEAVVVFFISPNFHVAMHCDKQLLATSRPEYTWFSSASQNFMRHTKLGRILTTKITRKRPQLKIEYEHSAAGLIQHILPVKISLVNEDSQPIFVKAVATVKGATSDMEHLTHLSIHPSVKHSKKSLIQCVSHNFGVLETSQNTSQNFNMQCLSTPGMRQMHIVVYSCFANDIPNSAQQQLQDELFFKEEKVIDISFYNAFLVEFRENRILCPLFPSEQPMGVFEDPSFPLERHYVWLITCRLENVYSIPLSIKSMTLEIPIGECGIAVKATPVQLETSAKEEILKPSEAIDRIYKLEVSVPISYQKDVLNVGNLNVFWRPIVSGSQEWLKTQLPFSSISLPTNALVVSVDIPHDASVGCLIPVEYKLRNTRMEIFDMTLHVDPSEHFVFSGAKSIRLRILPLGTQTFRLQVVPLNSGHCKLPHLRIMESDDVEYKDIDVLTSSGQVFGAASAISVFVRPLTGW